MESLIAPFDAYKGIEPYIFVSYAHKNSTLVFEYLTRLKEEGFRIWYDEGIDPGTDWSDEIAAALNNAAAFLVFLSSDAVESHNVKKEIVFALSLKKHMMCVYLEETQLPLGLQMQLGNIQAIMQNRFHDKEKFYARLIDALPQETRGLQAGSAEPQAAPQPISAPPPAQPAYTPPQATVTEEIPFEPVGKAVVTLKTGGQYTAPVNCMLTRSWESVYDGMAPDYNPDPPDITKFADMKKLKFASEEKVSEYRSALNFSWEDLGGVPRTLKTNDGSINFLLLDNDKLTTLKVNEIAAIDFDHEVSQPPVSTLTVQLKDGQRISMPKNLFFIGHKKKPDPDAMGWVSGRKWTAGFITDRGQTLAFSTLNSAKFLELSMESNRHYDRWVTNCMVELTIANGRKMVAKLKMDSIDFFGMDDFGPLQLAIEDMDRIDFA